MSESMDFDQFRKCLNEAIRKAESSPTDTWIEELVPAAIIQATKVASLVAEGHLFRSRGKLQISPREVAEEVSGEQSRGALDSLWSHLAPMLWITETEGLRHTLYETVTRAAYFEFVSRTRGVGQVEPLTYAAFCNRVRVVNDEVQELAHRWSVMAIVAKRRGLRQLEEATEDTFTSQLDASGMVSPTNLLKAVKSLTAEGQIPEDLTINDPSEECLLRQIARAFFSNAQAKLVDGLEPPS